MIIKQLDQNELGCTPTIHTVYTHTVQTVDTLYKSITLKLYTEQIFKTFA